MQEERGIALTVAIMSLALMITLGGIALQQAVTALRHTTKQANSKRALQAADAAIEAAAYAVARADLGGTLHIDPLNPLSVVTQNCIASVGSVGGIDVQALDPLTQEDSQGNQWCPETTPEATQGGATFSYRLSQLARVNSASCGMTGGALSLERWVVGVGRSGGEVRRVRALLKAPVAILSGAAVQSSSSTVPLTMSGSVKVVGDVTSNAAISGTPAQTIVGNVIPGPGKSVNTPGPGVTGSRTAACAAFTIPEVNQGTAATVNDNATGISEDCVQSVLFVITSCGSGSSAADKTKYDAATRTLTVSANGRATLTGSTYSFCSIVLEGNSVLRVLATNPTVRIFLDDPNNCRDSSGALLPDAGTIRMSQSGRIVNCHLDTQPQSLQIYAVGNPSISTTQILSAGGSLTSALRTTMCGISLPALLGEPMVVLAPHSRVELGGTVAISGQIAAETVRLAGNSSVIAVSALANIDRLGTSPLLPLYEPTDYLECTGLDFSDVPAASPSQGC
jgi:type II secretory pathway pseudopilin PulG/enamine deaminase RidA (YjgF/YER057c/UK114 family)